MENNNTIHDKIERYILGELTPDEHIAFEEEMHLDKSLAQEVEIMRHVIVGFERKGEQAAFEEMTQTSEDELQKIIISAEKRHKSKLRVMPMLVSFTAVAAAILVFFHIGSQPNYSAKQLFGTYYEAAAYENAPTRGSGYNFTTEQEAIIKEVFVFYEQKNYVKALNILNTILQAIPRENLPEEIVFYSSICMIETKQFDEAINSLKYLSSIKNIYQQDAEWYLALVYMDTNKQSDAKILLSRIAENKGLYSAKATELLSKLNEKKWF